MIDRVKLKTVLGALQNQEIRIEDLKRVLESESGTGNQEDREYYEELIDSLDRLRNDKERLLDMLDEIYKP